MPWLPKRRDRATPTKKNAALARIGDFHAEFREALLAAAGAGSNYSVSFVEGVLGEFEILGRRVDQATSGTELKTLEDQAASLSTLSAYLCPRGEIVAKAEAALQAMLEWSVPPAALETLRKQVALQLANPDDPEAARGALHTVFQEYDSWSDYIDEYNGEMQRTAYWLSGAIAVTLIGAVLLMMSRHVIWGVIVAGACGALVSVISKLPGLQISGDSAPYKRGIFRRLCTGLAASVIGAGLLATGVVTITLPNEVTVSQMFEACGKQTVSATPALGPPGSISPVPVKTGRSCLNTDVFILIGVVMLFGLSERALTAFEDKIFPGKS